jgi:DNA-binding MarR family transcriptional regulator
MEAWVRLLRTHAALARSLNSQLAVEHGLTINDYEALLLLSEAGGQGLRRTDLAQSIQLTASGVTRLLEGLQAEGLVAKRECSEDARVVYAVITEAGRERLAASSCSHVAAITGLFTERFSDEELAQLSELLGRLPGAPVACERV